MFFVNANRQQAFVLDGKTYETKGSNKGGTEWRLKHHAGGAFFRWLSTWAVAVGKPSDLGHDDNIGVATKCHCARANEHRRCYPRVERQ